MPPRADHRRPPAARLNRTRILSNLHKMLGIDAAAPRAAGRRPPPAAPPPPPKGQSRAYNPSFQGEVLDHEEPVASRRAKLNNSFKCGGGGGQFISKYFTRCSQVLDGQLFLFKENSCRKAKWC